MGDPMGFSGAALPFELRPHQRASVEAHLRVGTGRSHLVLPPGAGKTAVGVAIALHEGRRTLVLVPNTAIQQQWIDLWRTTLPSDAQVSDERDLTADVTVLTYQALATFDPDADDDAPLVQQLHPNAVRVLHALRDGDRFTLVLDEAHHLLHTWGRLLDEILAMARGGAAGDPAVVALTATPQTRLTPEQASLSERVFGPVLHEVSTPALVRSGVLAPFRELAWFVEPTDGELSHLADNALQWEELVTDLLDPHLASVGFLEHLDRTFVHRGAEPQVPWHRIVKQEPELALALLRLHHHRGLIDLPDGARLTAEAREPMAVADWVALIEEYAVRVLLRPGAPDQDHRAYRAIRGALPAVGWTLTRRGARPGRSPADRVLTHSAAKAQAVAEIAAAELAERGADLRALVITDFEQVAATASARLAPEAAPPGSAWQVLGVVADDPRLAQAEPLLVTGRSCAGTASALDRLVARVAAEQPGLAGGLIRTEVPGASGIFALSGPGWSPRRWVAAATAAFQAGECRLLVGTRGLLGEGWDAAALNVLIDATAATTPTAVVQVRGRALRRDPVRPDKVAHIYSLVAVADGHPLGDSDYRRFVAKHEGFLAPDDSGRITAGVGHASPLLDAGSVPDAHVRASVNTTTTALVNQAALVPELWGVGQPYDDVLVRVVRIVAAAPPGEPVDFDAPEVAERRPPLPMLAGTVLVATTAGGALGAAAGAGALPVALFAAGAATLTGGSWAMTRWRRSLRTSPDDLLGAIGAAVVEGMGSSRPVVVTPDGEGIWRVGLDTGDAGLAQQFAEAMEQALGPVDNPRYLISRRLPRQRAEQWHAVPERLGRNKARATVFEAAWTTHVSRGRMLFTRNPDGAGVLAAVQGLSPLDAACALRSEWR